MLPPLAVRDHGLRSRIGRYRNWSAHGIDQLFLNSSSVEPLTTLRSMFTIECRSRTAGKLFGLAKPFPIRRIVGESWRPAMKNELGPFSEQWKATRGSLLSSRKRTLFQETAEVCLGRRLLHRVFN
ncbi:hypothetical protein [Bradyrhizobium sp. JYMT SZCCT0428]|uniref:hypothetical protein n=1 Tax=Bradyrhizobium sp. JYMT SZCCT0428 TaxID=2807673 RepID=UPI001BA46780|nr:hypothetical protein [Bradyrhizobium sp. JYMT SZCCT0428]MBR1153965.1 hypothetical protein [Bradyrhizobium sp. JYMT SZCCT0428]